jgi:N-acetylglucosamine-1-phosphodiester alpha-N-acetylglucosaminidase
MRYLGVVLLLLAALAVSLSCVVARHHHPSPSQNGLELDPHAPGLHATEEGERAHAAKVDIITETQKLKEQHATAKSNKGIHSTTTPTPPSKRARHLQVPADEIIMLTPVNHPLSHSPKMPRIHSKAPDDGYVLHPIQISPTPGAPSGLNFTTFAYPTKQGLVHIYVGITDYPLGKFHIYPSPRNFDKDSMTSNLVALHSSNQSKKQYRSPMAIAAHFHNHNNKKGPLNGQCDGVAETSVSAQHYGCEFAQNAGFFDMVTGGCLGDVVSNGVSINTATSDLAGHAHFGTTKNQNFVTGYLTPQQVSNGVDGGFTELVTGAGWLIREGNIYINQSYVIEGLGEGFVAEIAPRNALGHDKYGRLLQFEADGEEDIQLGLDLWEFSAILSEHFNVVNAINMDGGGSSTTVYNGAVVDKPTCHDTPVECERSVTTISCVLP